jgi:gas vesicle protein
MSPFWGGLIIGLFLGCNVGVVVVALLVAAKSGEWGPKIESWLA